MKKRIRKGFVLITTLGVITVLSIAGGIATYLISKETSGTKSTKESTSALRIAESGAEIALSHIKQNDLNTLTQIDPSTYQITGNITNGNYTTIIKENANGTYTITSVGTFNGNHRTIIINAEKESGEIKSFAAAGTLTICNFDNLGRPGSRVWTNQTVFWTGTGFDFCPTFNSTIDASSWNVTFAVGPNGTITPEAEANLTPLTQDNSDAFIPSVGDANVTLPSYTCDIDGVTQVYTTTTSGPGPKTSKLTAVISGGTDVPVTDTNGDGRIVICNTSGSITVPEPISASSVALPLVLQAENDINIDAAIGDIDTVNLSLISESGNININNDIHLYAGDEKNVEIIAKEGNIYLNNEVQLTGKSEDYQVVVYAGDQILSDLTDTSFKGSSGTYLFDISGYESTNPDATSSVVVISQNGIDVGDTNFINVSGKEWLDLLVWSDGDINVGDIKYVANSEDETRYIGFLTSGNLTLGDMFFSGREYRSGLNYDEIVKWCNYTSSINSPVADFICELKNLIETQAFQSVKINSWKVY
ncbi:MULTISPECIES: hypothetical protein [unclassified Desulfurobacterium]|uniref:hypothetical protein n=1 Tax=Desulfurobacterium sp. TC5-1 TaxID=1158318 RepID=UPI0003B72931|nr:hypothetical protein [Desulfurobacterium sp. TC5-1]